PGPWDAPHAHGGEVLPLWTVEMPGDAKVRRRHGLPIRPCATEGAWQPPGTVFVLIGLGVERDNLVHLKRATAARPTRPGQAVIAQAAPVGPQLIELKHLRH